MRRSILKTAAWVNFPMKMGLLMPVKMMWLSRLMPLPHPRSIYGRFPMSYNFHHRAPSGDLSRRYYQYLCRRAQFSVKGSVNLTGTALNGSATAWKIGTTNAITWTVSGAALVMSILSILKTPGRIVIPILSRLSLPRIFLIPGV